MKCSENTTLTMVLFKHQGRDHLLPHSHSLMRASVLSAAQLRHLLRMASVLRHKQFRGTLLPIPATSGYEDTDGFRQQFKWPAQRTADERGTNKRWQRTGTNREIPLTKFSMPQRFTWFPVDNGGDLKLPCSLVILITAKKEDHLGLSQWFENRIVCLE